MRRAVPSKVLDEIRAFRTFGRQERWLYLKTRVLDSIKGTPETRVILPNPATSFLFVCFGNIMRSPMCEELMKQAIGKIPNLQLDVTSAGINATPGRAAHPWAIAAAREYGISLDTHRARLLTAEMLHQADVIFVMDYHNRVQLLLRHPEVAGKVMMLGDYLRSGDGLKEIRDPYYDNEEGTRRCYEILNKCIANLVSDLSANPAPCRAEKRG